MQPGGHRFDPGQLHQFNVGRQYDYRVRIAVQSRLAPNIGLEEFLELHTPELVRPIPAKAGSQRKLARTIFDN